MSNILVYRALFELRMVENEDKQQVRLIAKSLITFELLQFTSLKAKIV
jgi:hypothetical protein